MERLWRETGEVGASRKSWGKIRLSFSRPLPKTHLLALKALKTQLPPCLSLSMAQKPSMAPYFLFYIFSCSACLSSPHFQLVSSLSPSDPQPRSALLIFQFFSVHTVGKREGKLSISNDNAIVCVPPNRDACAVTKWRGFEMEGRGRGSQKKDRDIWARP